MPAERRISVGVADNISEGATIALLPRGFSFALESGSRWSWHPPFSCFDCSKDQELFQVAFSRNRVENFIGPADDPRRERWEFQTILKDQKKPRDINPYRMREGEGKVAIIGGTGIGIMCEPFELEARSPDNPFPGRCVAPDGERRTDAFVVENVPFQHAVPVLTGFDMSFNCRRPRRLGRFTIVSNRFFVTNPEARITWSIIECTCLVLVLGGQCHATATFSPRQLTSAARDRANRRIGYGEFV